MKYKNKKPRTADESKEHKSLLKKIKEQLIQDINKVNNNTQISNNKNHLFN
jgi:hypothetical protein